MSTDLFDLPPHSPPPLTLSELLGAGNLHCALRLLKGLDRIGVADALLRAGFGVAGHTSRDMIGNAQGQLIAAALARTDGFGLRAVLDAKVKPTTGQRG